jgi:hypothetical protein
MHLPDLYKQEPLQDFLYYAAVHAGSRMLDFTVINTPVDSGNLRTSWYNTPVRIAHVAGGAIAYETTVATDVEYAGFVEHGTGEFGPHHARYRIRAKGKGKGGADYLRFVVGGKVVFAREVWHPGSPGQHMVAIAAAMTEAQLDRILHPVLEAWTKAQERGIGLRLRSAARFPAELRRGDIPG